MLNQAQGHEFVLESEDTRISPTILNHVPGVGEWQISV
jgi:hypothetical protein